jgi:hypothetical protein
MKSNFIYAVLELSSEVISLKTKLGSMGTNMKGATDTTSELTLKTPFLHSFGNDK